MKISHTKITASVNTGMSYWYKFKHGLGPGTMPKGVNVLKVIEDGWKDYVLLDQMLTTDELNMYEIKEETPPDELLREAGYSDINETYAEFNSASDINSTSRSLNSRQAKVPAPFDQWYEIDANSEFDDYGGSPAEETEGYDVIHLAWVKAKDEYFDYLANNGIEYCELLSEGGGDPFLGYVVHDRLYPVSESEVLSCLPEDEEDIEMSEKVECSKENPNIFDFYGWYNNLSAKQRNMVDDWADSEGYPLYDDCSQLELSNIMDHFGDLVSSGHANFHVSAYGNDFNELQDASDYDSPKDAIKKWMQLQQKYPLDAMITGFAAQEQALRDYVVSHPDWIRELCKRYNCPYDPEYLISESEKPSRMKPSEYTDQLHPFGLG